MYKNKIQQEIENLTEIKSDLISLERPKQKEHGDLATNVAMKLTKTLKKSPLEIATEIKDKIAGKENIFSKVEIAKPGFINFTLSTNILCDSLHEVVSLGQSFGLAKPKTKEKILLEYVSANPTGDLHIGHGRQAAIGDTLSNVLEAAGHDISREFYINDFGEQIRNLSETSFAILEKINGKSPEWKEEFYPEETIKPYVEKVMEEKGKDINKEDLGQSVKKLILEDQTELLKSIRVEFDKWFSETDLHKAGEVEKILEKLKSAGHTYEKEGAIWFKAKEFGDVRDRVLKRSDGRPTYITADIAYHIDKFNRGNKHLINVWGADHHGQEVGLKGCLNAAGVSGDDLEVVFVQMVSIKKDGQEVKMSKRAGTVVNVKDVLSEVGADALRYFLVESGSNNRMVFDIDLAKKQDKDNPVFYIQYAHARCCSIFRQLLNSDENVITKDVTKESILKEISENKNFFNKLFDVKEEEKKATKSLILKILDFPEEIQIAAKTRATGRIANYLKELATEYHQFYTVCRVLTDDLELTKARLGLIESTRIAIANGLKILGISAPEKM